VEEKFEKYFQELSLYFLEKRKAKIKTADICI